MMETGLISFTEAKPLQNPAYRPAAQNKNDGIARHFLF
jgi:hypothetical protein